jgi:HlyD family secretion protein
MTAGVGIVWWRGRSAPAQYLTAPVTRGSIVRAIIATGTVDPVVTVQVGSYVSGTIQSLSCDYNSEVKANQVCAKIDPRPYQVVVDQAAALVANGRAQLGKDQASLVYAKLNYDRDLGLLKQGVASQDNVDGDKSALDQATSQVALDEATIVQRQAALRAAQVNLQYTDIVSPVTGTVISRNIDVGQTVASSFQTPTLFLVAKDLTRMQVDASVSESDIGSVAVGQPASFTVEAFPDRTFRGRVVQIRRAPISVQNVVTYDVVVGVDNPDKVLLPGMTANSRIVTAERDSVRRIPLPALRFDPAGAGRGGASRRSKDAAGRVWVLRDGALVPLDVVTGTDDGTLVEVVSGALITTDRVVVGEPAGSSRPAAGRSLGPAQAARPGGRF